MNITIAVRGTNDQELCDLTAGKIISHISPDWDSIGSAWGMLSLAKQDVDIVLVPSGTPARLFANARFAADVGGVYAPRSGRFDHHQWADNNTSATALVFDEMSEYGYQFSGELAAFARTITAADLGKSHDGAAESRRNGLHAVLSSWKAQRVPDDEILRRGISILDRLDAGESQVSILADYADDVAAAQAAQVEAAAEYTTKLVYRSDDGKVQALSDAKIGATFEAYANGAVLVVFFNSDTHASGASRQGEATTPHVGSLIDSLSGAAAVETADWYRHPTGFFAGLSPKAGNVRDMVLPLADLAAAIDQAWRR